MSNIAIIPARGGSQRIPYKNIIVFLGKPMIIHTLDAAKKSKVFEKILVSTEDEKIRQIVESHGYDVIDRPADLASDTASLVPVVLDILSTLNESGETYENACLLMANCPARGHVEIYDSWKKFENTESNFMMSVFKFGMFYPFWALELRSDGLKPFFGEKYFKARSQDLPEVFCPSGAIRWFDIKIFQKVKTFYGPNLQPYVIPWNKAIDIDDYDDLQMAKIAMEANDRVNTPPIKNSYS